MRVFSTLLLNLSVTVSCSTALLQKELCFNQQQLHSKVANAFPLERNPSVLTMRFIDPEIILEPESNLIGLAVAVVVQTLGVGRLHGLVQANGHLAYRPQEGAFVIVDNQIRRVHVEGLRSRHDSLVKKVAVHMAAEFPSDITVYRLRENDFQQPWPSCC